MVIPVYILPALAFLFFIAGGIAAKDKKKKNEEYIVSSMRKKISFIFFMLFITFFVLSMVIIPQKGKIYGKSFKVLTTTLNESDVTVMYPEKIDTKNVSLEEDKTFLKTANSEECLKYKDSLYNVNIVSRNKVISITQTNKLNKGRITISQCLVKEKILCFWKISRGYRISIAEE